MQIRIMQKLSLLFVIFFIIYVYSNQNKFDKTNMGFDTE